MKKLKDITSYIAKPENLELFLVTSNFSVNVDEEILDLIFYGDKSLEEYKKQEIREGNILKPIVDSMNRLLGYISEYSQVITEYFILESVNYRVNIEGRIVISFTWEKVVKHIPRQVYSFITEHDKSKVIMYNQSENDKTLQIFYGMV